ncbi:MAG: tail fiber domain-containing protein [Saprospiraceae bacterium]|nr:tail fiber domain-containing protein [Candidatus Vicinibacter affinis]
MKIKLWSVFQLVFRTFILILFVFSSGWTQVPYGLNFQTIVRDKDGKPIIQRNINIQFSILKNSTTGEVVYSEEHRTSVNEFGLANVLIGYGFPLLGRFNQINWADGGFFLKTEIDPNGGSNYELSSISPFLSVPYALYAEKTKLDAGPGIMVEGNRISAEDSSSMNEIQILSLNNNQLNLSKGGGSVTLSTTADNWGAQVVVTNTTLTGDGTISKPLGLSDNSVSSSKILNGSILLEDLASGVIPNYSAGNGIQLNNQIITNTGDLSNTNELQTLNFNTSTQELSISNGNTIRFPVTSASRIHDADGNTQVQVEKNPNEDIIRFDVKGIEKLSIHENPFGSTMLEIEGNNSNLFLGKDAGGQNTPKSNATEGSFNTFIGQLSGVNNTIGTHNTGLGTYALWYNVNGKHNTSIGFESSFFNENGNFNVAVGRSALHNNRSGSSNVAIGAHALEIGDKIGSNVAIGPAAMFYNNRSNIVAIGDSSLFNNGSGSLNENQGIENVGVGSKTLYTNTVGSGNSAFGTLALYSNINGNNNVASGAGSLFSNTSGHSNSALGYHTLFANETGYTNVAIGTNSLSANFDGFGNTAIGSTSMFGNINGNVNTAVGLGALFSNESGSYNTAVGSNSLSENYTGINNTSVGAESMKNNYQGVFNTALGTYALYENKNGYNNTAVGNSAGSVGALNESCTYIGHNSTNNGSINLSKSTAIGADSRVNASNQIRIGDATTVSIGGYKSWTNISDGRFKKDVVENVIGLDFILKLRPVSYVLDIDQLETVQGIKSENRKSFLRNQNSTAANSFNPVRQTGFIAQEVQKASDACGFQFSGVDRPQNENDFYGLRYAEFVVPLVKSVQEQQQIINAQKLEIEQLKSKLNQLENLELRLSQLEKLNK